MLSLERQVKIGPAIRYLNNLLLEVQPQARGIYERNIRSGLWTQNTNKRTEELRDGRGVQNQNTLGCQLY